MDYVGVVNEYLKDSKIDRQESPSTRSPTKYGWI